jgi:hypothetical protein
LGGVNPSAVASNLALNPDFSPILTEALGTNAAFQIGVAQNLATSGNFQTAVSSFITGTEQEAQNFRTNLIESMAKDVRFRGPQGAQGTFNVNAMERELKDKRTLWCADGELCKVPSAKGTGIQFTGGDQIIQGFASTATDPKVVKLDDHLALNASGSIDFARNLTREEGVTNSENIGKLDGRILANFPAGNQPEAIDGTALEIHGISKPQAEARRKLVKVYDDIQVMGGGFKKFPDLRENNDKGGRNDWTPKNYRDRLGQGVFWHWDNNSGTPGAVQTIVPWPDTTGGVVTQTKYGHKAGILVRVEKTDSTWSGWGFSSATDWSFDASDDEQALRFRFNENNWEQKLVAHNNKSPDDKWKNVVWGRRIKRWGEDSEVVAYGDNIGLWSYGNQAWLSEWDGNVYSTGDRGAPTTWNMRRR